ncbi:hypothetical protein [Vacuolonema iberomarrocanum]|uniref:hypothetical protein n=1 Tax=Vacuolonema iberomarrocanum TaxID=3454632 RepID=UPI001A04E4D6|nr:hypothetical protein [filamentous cyanobacterium LEGE 07170]
MKNNRLKARYFSQHFNISLDGNETWFDTRLDQDTKLYIDPFLIFRSDIPEFSNTREKFSNFFKYVIGLILKAERNSNALEKLEEHILYFREAGEIQLGDSTTCRPGNGPGKKFAKACIDALKLLIDRNYRKIEHFEKIQIFTPNIGIDGISDTTAHILKEEFIRYTRRICRELNIATALCPVEHAKFNEEDKVWESQTLPLPENPFCPRQGILLVPKDFLCTSNAINSGSFSKYVARQKGKQLATNLNFELEEKLDEKEISDIVEKSISRKEVISIAKAHLEWVDEYIEQLEQDKSITSYNLSEDKSNLYRPQKEAYSFIRFNRNLLSPTLVSSESDFILCIEGIINNFKSHVEEESGYKLLWNDPLPSKDGNSSSTEPYPRKESAVQLLFLGIVNHYCRANDIDPSREVETGKGPVDFKFSTGYRNRALIEIKLASSSKLRQGFERQLPAYLKAHNVDHGYYIVVFHKESEKKKIDKILNEVKSEKGILQGKVVVIDATRNKPSASNL